MVSRARIPLMALAVSLVIVLISMNFVGITIQKEEPKLYETRANVSESEPNDSLGQADQLTRSHLNIKLTGTVATSSDNDYFKIDLNGGGTTVDNVAFTPQSFGTGGNPGFIIWVRSAYPRSNDNGFMFSEYWWRTETNFQQRSFDASYTGTYYFQFKTTSTTDLDYEVWINITTKTPTDDFNDLNSAKAITAAVSNQNISIPTDTFDWYEVTLPNSDWPTHLDLTVNIDDSYSTTYASYDIVVDVPIWIGYTLKSSPAQMTWDQYYASRDLETSHSNPKIITFEKNVTDLFIGLKVESWGDDPDDTSHYLLDSPYSEAWALFSFTNFDLYPVIPNKRPILLNGMVTPTAGRTSDTYIYEVTYTDADNDPPAWVKVSYDGNEVEMAPKSGQGTDFTTGVIYTYSVPGSQLGEGPHNFIFSAFDGEHDAAGDIDYHHFPNIDNNYAPEVKGSAPTTYSMYEDQGAGYVDLTSIFNDQDPQTLDYKLLNQGSWASTLNTEIAQFTIVGANETLKIVPEQDKFGEVTVTLNASDGKAWVVEPHEITINISSRNDDPVITKVGSKAVYNDQVNIVLDEGEWFNFTVEAADPADGDSVYIDWDIDEVLADAEEDVNFFNNGDGTLGFVSSDGDVNQPMEVMITATDDNGGETVVKTIFNIKNVNNRPVVTDPGEQTVGQYDTLELTIEATDPDLDSGDEITFFTNTQEIIPGLVSESNYFFNELTGELTIQFSKQQQVGEHNVKIGSRDSSGAEGSITIKITVTDANDPPVPGDITVFGQPNNLSITASAKEAIDPEGDSLTYIWNFGDGSTELSAKDLLSVDHTYPSAGSYNLTLKVTDGSLFTELVKVVTVTEKKDEPEPPVDDDDDDDDIEPPDENNTDDDVQEDDDTSDPKGSNMAWFIILIIILVLAAVVLIIILLFAKKKKKKEDEDVDDSLLLEPSSLEEKEATVDDGLLEPTLAPEASGPYASPDQYDGYSGGSYAQDSQQQDPQYTKPMESEPAPDMTSEMDQVFGDMLAQPVGVEPDPVPGLDEEQVPEDPAPEPDAGTPDLQEPSPAEPEPAPAEPSPSPEPTPEGQEEPSLDNLFAPVSESGPEPEPAPAEQDPRIGQNLQVSCYNCGELMEVEVTQIPLPIACWNCGTESVVE